MAKNHQQKFTESAEDDLRGGRGKMGRVSHGICGFLPLVDYCRNFPYQSTYFLCWAYPFKFGLGKRHRVRKGEDVGEGVCKEIVEKNIALWLLWAVCLVLAHFLGSDGCGNIVGHILLSETVWLFWLSGLILPVWLIYLI